MLATLNLQLSAAELLDAPAGSSASLLPPSSVDIESGFAQLLRLRVDASQAADAGSGQVLPPGGSALPISPTVGETTLSIETVSPAVADEAELLSQSPALITTTGEPEALAERPQSGLAEGPSRAAPEAVPLQPESAEPLAAPFQVTKLAAAIASALPEPASTSSEPLPVAPETTGTLAAAASTSLELPSDPLLVGPEPALSTNTEVPAQPAAKNTGETIDPTATELVADSAEQTATRPDALEPVMTAAPPLVSLSSALPYPAPGEVLAEAATPLAAALNAAPSAPLDPVVRDGATTVSNSADHTARAPLASPSINTTRDALAARTAEVVQADAERQAPLPVVGLALKDRGLRAVTEDAPRPVTPNIGAVPGQPPLQAARRPEILPLLQVDISGEAFNDIVQPRKATQSLHPLQSLLNLQPPQAAAPSGGGVATSELTYAGAARQATDLISTQVKDPAWGERVGERVLLMASHQMKSAEIRLTPAELGPLRIQVSVDDGAAHVTFHAQHALTRDAIEQALPRLREMLAENGLSLGQADVADRGVAEGNKDNNSDGHGGHGNPDALPEVGMETERQSRAGARAGIGLVDTFA